MKGTFWRINVREYECKIGYKALGKAMKNLFSIAACS